MNRPIFIGIDTSNYTTSVGIVDADGTLVANLKRPLTVKDGERGLRQSDAVFNHVRSLPSIMEEARGIVGGREILAVGVSDRPRNIEGSYMPCFLSGVSAAMSLCAPIGLEPYRFSHQCGHIMAAIYSSGAELSPGEEFAALHVSGGTTELLRAKRDGGGFTAELVGGTLDLNAGQVIDRIGVSLGLPFPAGPHLERLALEYRGRVPKRRPSVSGMHFNLSGAENLAAKVYRESGDMGATAAFVFDHVGRAIAEICAAYTDAYGPSAFVFAGGVMCNSIIKDRLTGLIPRAYFAEPQLSADNAVGIAVLTRESYLKKN